MTKLFRCIFLMNAKMVDIKENCGALFFFKRYPWTSRYFAVFLTSSSPLVVQRMKAKEVDRVRRAWNVALDFWPLLHN